MFVSPKFNRLIAIFAAVSVAGAAMPAFAKSGERQMRLSVEQQDGKTVYCAKQSVTGSSIPVRTCLTQEEWNQRGAKINIPADGIAAAASNKAASQN